LAVIAFCKSAEKRRALLRAHRSDVLHFHSA
jgi:hypothetical protein